MHGEVGEESEERECEGVKNEWLKVGFGWKMVHGLIKRLSHSLRSPLLRRVGGIDRSIREIGKRMHGFGYEEEFLE